MKKKISPFLFSVFFIFQAHAQTITETINYSGLTYPTSDYNIFNPSPSAISGLTHYTLSGGVSNVNTGILLNTRGSSSYTTEAGTAFGIARVLKPGYKYSISVKARVVAGVPVALNLKIGGLVSLPNNTLTQGSIAGAVGYAYYNLVESAGTYLGSDAVSGSSFITYSTVEDYAPTTTFNYLYILFFGGHTDGNAVLIESIEIKQTASFTLPSAVSVTCGTTTAKTFNIVNGLGTTGITGYLWYPGTTPNGWLFNGNPAPANIATTTPSLILTPVCGDQQKPVLADVSADGKYWRTNTSSITKVLPTVSIIGGVSNLCAGSSTYELSGYSCNTGVSWTVAPAGVVTTSPSGRFVTLNKVGNGAITLTANVTACGSSFSTSKQIEVGATNYEYEIIPVPISSNTICHKAGKNYSFKVLPLSTDPLFASGTYEWKLIRTLPSTSSWTLPATGTTVNLSFPSSGIYDLQVRRVNTCGTGTWSSYAAFNGEFDVSYNCTPSLMQITLSPNPSHGELIITTVEEDDEQTNSNDKTIININRVTSGTAVKQWTVGFSKTLRFNIGDLPKGVYVVTLTKNNTIASAQLMVE